MFNFTRGSLYPSSAASTAAEPIRLNIGWMYTLPVVVIWDQSVIIANPTRSECQSYVIANDRCQSDLMLIRSNIRLKWIEVRYELLSFGQNQPNFPSYADMIGSCLTEILIIVKIWPILAEWQQFVTYIDPFQSDIGSCRHNAVTIQRLVVCCIIIRYIVFAYLSITSYDHGNGQSTWSGPV